MTEITIPTISQLAKDVYPSDPNLVGPFYELEYGPYEGFSIADVFDNAPRFIYMIEKDKSLRSFKAKESLRTIYALRFKHYCSENPLDDVPNHEIEFGKHKGKALSKLHKREHQYCDWLMRNYPNRDDLYLNWHKAQVFLRNEYGMGVPDKHPVKSVKEINDEYLSKKPVKEDDEETEEVEQAKPKKSFSTKKTVSQALESDSESEIETRPSSKKVNAKIPQIMASDSEDSDKQKRSSKKKIPKK